ncbi:ABC-type multidrug transport system, ATPase and permease components [Bellilinea caldifistulae]|uniref:ABC transporter n=1 Tax=Bellilinea caldifistulae TaxID=360411 RepID=A0A0N8GL49_9CHLR|nr:ABC transporter ATP-binding protein [Bellilinea caldifistulae]KPL71506.1 ABC transporter [Bellilinea caldifistulae]GAP10820.1 ABC-type multidrug transport system, ATPase and permease components [Bellilinea caldifistulae]
MNAEFSFPHLYSTDRRGPVRWILSHLKYQWWLVIVAVIGALGNAGLAGVVPVMIGQAVNLVNGGNFDRNRLLQIVLIIVISQTIRGVLQFARNFGFEVIAQRIERNIRQELYVSLLGKSMTFHSLQPVGDTMARATNDVREVNFLFSPGVNLVIGSLIFIFVPIVVAPRYHPSLVLVPLLFVVIYFILLRFYLKELEPVTDEVRYSFGILNTRLNEALDGIEVVKGAAQEQGEVMLFGKNVDRYRKAAIKQGDIEARFLPALLLAVAMGGGLLHALILFKQGLINTGDVVAYFGLLVMLSFPTFVSIFAYSRISLGLAGARRILELMNRENNLDQNENGHHGIMQGDVVFDQVSFAYQNNETVLKDVSFHVRPGQIVAIVGQTGSGKTTLVKLINRIYDVTSGRVLVDGVDVRDWNLESLRRQISIIEQDIFLFSQTIAENIAFGKPGASMDEIVKAATAAQADEFIRSFDKGYDTVIGERGVTLSGGQRQRLALARAFLTQPSILILDDSTSAIDSATEDKIQRAIYTAAQGRTTFIITHRLSQIRWADLILVLRKGELVAVGSHEELMKTSETYRNIFQEL